MKDFKGELGHYKWIETKDGSLGLWSEHFNEGLHSYAGAVSETQYNFIHLTELADKLTKKHQLTIFETGLGLGLGVYQVIQTALELSKSQQLAIKKISFITVELDQTLILRFSAQFQEAFKQNKISVQKQNSQVLTLQIDFQDFEFNLSIIAGDARAHHHLIDKTARQCGFIDVIFQDAFSPKNNPSLWTVEWFTLLKKISNENVVLTTYCASIRARMALYQAGWILENVPGFANKKSATRAFLSAKNIDLELMKLLQKTKTPPWRDSEIKKLNI